MSWEIGEVVQTNKGKATAISRTETHITFQLEDGRTFDMRSNQTVPPSSSTSKAPRKTSLTPKAPKAPKVPKVPTEEELMAELEATIAAAKEKLGVVKKAKASVVTA